MSSACPWSRCRVAESSSARNRAASLAVLCRASLALAALLSAVATLHCVIIQIQIEFWKAYTVLTVYNGINAEESPAAILTQKLLSTVGYESCAETGLHLSSVCSWRMNSTT